MFHVSFTKNIMYNNINMVNYYSYDLKIQIINMYLYKNKTPKELSILFDISLKSIYNWLNLFKNNKLLKHKINYVKKDSYFRNSLIRCNIKLYIVKNPSFIYHKLIKFIFKNININISKSMLYNIIKDLNFSKKNITFSKKYGKKSKITAHTKKLKKNIKNIPLQNIISIDEISFDTNIFNNKAWNLKGQKIFKKIGATYKRLTLICAITNSKILHYKIINNSSDSIIFLDFLKEINILPNNHILLDNARIHHSKIVKAYTAQNNINLIFNTPYSPQYNPIERMFSKLKFNVKKYSNNHNKQNLIENIKKSLKTIKKQDLKNYFIHSINKNLLNIE